VSVPAPPSTPLWPDELEALIREARARQRRRRIAVAAFVGIAAGAGLAIWAVVPGNSRGLAGGRSSRNPVVRARRCPPGDLGTLAFARGGALRLLELHGCRARTLVRDHVAGPIAMSADGRWVSFRGGYVSVRHGTVRRLPGDLVWSPAGHRFALITKRGGLELGRAGGPLRRVLPRGWGAWTTVFSPDGRRLAVSRTAGRARIEEIWVLDLATGSRRELFREPRREGAPLLLQSFSPDGRWLLFWKDLYASASILADGVPLLAVPVAGGRPQVLTKGELYYRDFLSWCGGSLVYVIDHGGRMVAQGDGLAFTAPPQWQSRAILPAGGRTSWTSFACSSSGALAVAAGPSRNGEPFGREHRSIWLVRDTKASVLAATRPPSGASDEWPSWSADGKWLLFVRTRLRGRSSPGTLFALQPGDGKLVGPIAQVGATENYYGHYAWTSQLSWHRP
jgi:WD40-like Beta Propeller Repeat